ncbi:Fanconi anemia group D2 protein-like protein [Smittium mucronatum]|uniref:Fanconi anemia group D2 protein-like protein n=1 Tax=Smittium mucronatum TaxID=133383 RepID=A0A1R0H4R2_9FUNG|nr:Fanconi anemia group D2 protein-like protein [Smittium mucronatum]
MAFDELANLVDSTKLHPQLQSWMAENIANSFAEAFLSSLSEIESRKKGPYKRLLTLFQEKESEVVLDIYGLLIGDNIQGIHSALVQTPLTDNQEKSYSFRNLSGNVACCLFPLFRFMQVCEKINNCGSLADIDAVIGCGIILPSSHMDFENEFEVRSDLTKTFVHNITDQSEPYQVMIGSSLFLVCNWFRELINAFGSQKSSNLKLKSLNRLNQLALIEDLLTNLSQRVLFDPIELGIVTPIGNVCSVPTLSTQDPWKSSIDENYQISIGDSQADQSFADSSVLEHTNLKKSKPRKRVSGGNSASVNSWKSYRRDMNPSVYDFVYESVLIPNLEPYSEVFSEMNISANALILIMEELRSYLDVDKVDNIPKIQIGDWSVLRGILLSSKTADSKSIHSFSLKVLSIRAFDYLFQFSQRFEADSNSILLIQFLQSILYVSKVDLPNLENNGTITSNQPYEDSVRALGKISGNFLKSKESSFQKTEIEFLIKLFIESNYEQPHIVMGELVNVVLAEYGDVESNSENDFHTLNNETASIYIKSIFVSLSTQFSILPGRKNDDKIKVLYELCRIFQMILFQGKRLSDLKGVLTTCLRFGHHCIDIFTKKVLPYLELVFMEHKEDIVTSLICLQKATRTLQIFCGHSKVVRDLRLTKIVPMVRRSLEAVILRVKFLLKNNNILSTFEIGVLKHRSIDGEEVSSQIPLINSSPDESHKRSHSSESESESDAVSADDESS